MDDHIDMPIEVGDMGNNGSPTRPETKQQTAHVSRPREALPKSESHFSSTVERVARNREWSPADRRPREALPKSESHSSSTVERVARKRKRSPAYRSSQKAPLKLSFRRRRLRSCYSVDNILARVTESLSQDTDAHKTQRERKETLTAEKQTSSSNANGCRKRPYDIAQLLAAAPSSVTDAPAVATAATAPGEQSLPHPPGAKKSAAAAVFAVPRSPAHTSQVATKKSEINNLHFPPNANGTQWLSMHQENLKPIGQRQRNQIKRRGGLSVGAVSRFPATLTQESLCSGRPAEVKGALFRRTRDERHAELLMKGGPFTFDLNASTIGPGGMLMFETVKTQESVAVLFDSLDKHSRSLLARHYQEDVVYTVIGFDSTRKTTSMTIELQTDHIYASAVVGWNSVRLCNTPVDSPWADIGQQQPDPVASISKGCVVRNLEDLAYADTPIKDILGNVVSAKLVRTYDRATRKPGWTAVQLNEYMSTINHTVAINSEILRGAAKDEHHYFSSTITGTANNHTAASYMHQAIMNCEFRDAMQPSGIAVSYAEMDKQLQQSEFANKRNVMLFFSVRQDPKNPLDEATDINLLRERVLYAPLAGDGSNLHIVAESNANQSADHLLECAQRIAKTAGCPGPDVNETDTPAQQNAKTSRWCTERIDDVESLTFQQGDRASATKRQKAQLAPMIGGLHRIRKVLRYQGIKAHGERPTELLPKRLHRTLCALHVGWKRDDFKRSREPRPTIVAAVDQQTRPLNGRMESCLVVRPMSGRDEHGRPTLVMMGQAKADDSYAFRLAGPQKVRVQLIAKPNVVFHARIERNTNIDYQGNTGFTVTPIDDVVIEQWPRLHGDAMAVLRVQAISDRPTSKESVATPRLQSAYNALQIDPESTQLAVLRLCNMMKAPRQPLPDPDLVRGALMMMNQTHEVYHILNEQCSRLRRALVRCLAPNIDETTVHTLDVTDQREMIEFIANIVRATANARVNIPADIHREKVVIVGPVALLKEIICYLGANHWQFKQTLILCVTKFEHSDIQHVAHLRCTSNGYRQRAIEKATAGESAYKIDAQIPSLVPGSAVRGDSISEASVETIIEEKIINTGEVVLMSNNRYMEKLSDSPTNDIFHCRTLILAGMAALNESDTIAALAMESKAKRVVSFWHPEPVTNQRHTCGEHELMRAMIGPLATLHAMRRKLNKQYGQQ